AADGIRVARPVAGRRSRPRARGDRARQESAPRPGGLGHAATPRPRRTWARRPGRGGAQVRAQGARMKRFLVVNGPNLNLLGKREPHIYGTQSLADLMDAIRVKAGELQVRVDFFQANDEGEIIDFLQKEAPASAGIIINPAAFAHYSLALFDCLQALAIPVVEVHISNIHAR